MKTVFNLQRKTAADTLGRDPWRKEQMSLVSVQRMLFKEIFKKKSPIKNLNINLYINFFRTENYLVYEDWSNFVGQFSQKKILQMKDTSA